MRAYLHKNYCGLGDRIIVHPKGLPLGWRHSNMSEEGRRAALDSADRIYSEHREVTNENQLRILRMQSPMASRFYIHRHGFVLHLNPETLELVEAHPIV